MAGKARIAILGAGLMGHGIAQVFAQNGHGVRIYDRDAKRRGPACGERIRANLRDLGESEGGVDLVAPAANASGRRWAMPTSSSRPCSKISA